VKQRPWCPTDEGPAGGRGRTEEASERTKASRGKYVLRKLILKKIPNFARPKRKPKVIAEETDAVTPGKTRNSKINTFVIIHVPMLYIFIYIYLRTVYTIYIYIYVHLHLHLGHLADGFGLILVSIPLCSPYKRIPFFSHNKPVNNGTIINVTNNNNRNNNNRKQKYSYMCLCGWF